MSNFEDFSLRLNRGPAFLFLGQGHLKRESGTDPLLGQVKERFGIASSDDNYDLLLECSNYDDSTAFLAWVNERGRRLSAPDALRVVADFAWNGVISSAIDPIWLPAFRNDWREVAPIYDNEYLPSNPRSRRELHTTFLFGSVNQIEPKQRPPLSRMEYYSRRRIATNLLERLPDVITPFGVLAIDGYDFESDWLRLDDFYGVLGLLGPSQVHIFGVREAQLSDAFLDDLVQQGILVPHTENLATILNRAASQGLIHIGAQPDLDERSRRVSYRDRSINVPRELWNRVSNSGTILDEQVLTPPPSISEEARYWEFRRFLFECGIRPLWSGYSRGFAFRREFESQLRITTMNRLQRVASNNLPIIVHGQTGTGKTVALGALAFDIATSGAYPTIFIERKTQRPVGADIDRCCELFENDGADATLIVWDGMVEPSDYFELQGFLASRGRNAVVVGSSYKQDVVGDHLVAVPDSLSEIESDEFLVFLKDLGVGVTQRHADALKSRDASYLVALYRFLPPSRPHIRTGVVRELERLENELLSSVNRSSNPEQPLTPLASAFLSAGIIDQSRLEQLQSQSQTLIDFSTVSDLVDIVTVPGQFGLSIPIELLARACGTGDFTHLGQILRAFDLINAYEDPTGKISIGPRHPLEAQLIVQARVGGVRREAEIIARIIEAMRPSYWPDESDEVDFAIAILQAVGPRGADQMRFANVFRDIAESIANARNHRNVINPRLMLQQAFLLRGCLKRV